MRSSPLIVIPMPGLLRQPIQKCNDCSAAQLAGFLPAIIPGIMCAAHPDLDRVAAIPFQAVQLADPGPLRLQTLPLICMSGQVHGQMPDGGQTSPHLMIIM